MLDDNFSIDDAKNKISKFSNMFKAIVNSTSASE